MARYEGSKADNAEDARGAKATGMSKKAYEGSARDRTEDEAGERRISVSKHHRKPPSHKPKHHSAPMPGQHEFNADEEQSMRQGARASRMPPPPMDDDAAADAAGPGMDDEDAGGFGGFGG